MNEREILRRMIPYVPPYWVRQAFADPTHSLVGREERIYAAVLFVDISGFTPISEALAEQKQRGVEELSAILDRYFTVMSEPVAALGGEVVKFAGDSLIVLFPAHPDLNDAHLGAALACSLRMQAAMSEFAQVKTSAGTFPLRIKIGIGGGAIYNTTVGDEQNGMQPVFAGRPLARCMQAEDMADAGEIVADAALVNRTPGRLDVGEARGTFRLIEGATDVPLLPPIEQADVSGLDARRSALLIQRLSPYLSTQLVARIRQGSRGVFGEHRQVTVMFVKFGGLNYDWEPAVGHVLQVYFTTMRDCILRYGGRLNEVDVDADGGILVVFFGAPTAHEDDELRAVSCAWDMQRAVADVRTVAGSGAERLTQCIGISSGSVFVGDVGGPVRRTYTTVGLEVNLASRLMNLAEWNQVLVTSWVQKRVMDRFAFQAMGEVKVKGKSDLVPLFSLIAPHQREMDRGIDWRSVDRRFWLGRTAELDTLRTVQEQAWQGNPQLLLVIGQAGMGKSRLVKELMRLWVEQGGRAFAGDCHRQGNGILYAPWSGLLRAAFDLQESDLPEHARVEVMARLNSLSPSLARGTDLFYSLLRCAHTDQALMNSLVAGHGQARLSALLADFVQTLARRQPLLLVFEDVHEIDDASLALLNGLLGQVRNGSLLICAILRPKRDIEILDHVISTTYLVLDELSHSDSLALARNLLANAGLSPDLALRVVEQTQGNPFFLQEVVQALAALALSSEFDAETALVQGAVLPESIADTIQAQLDHLDEDFKLTLRIAAVIGQQFEFKVLQAAHPVPISSQDLAARLSTLERMHLIRLEHMGADIHYRFRHPMTQKVIYANLLSADRERFHLRVGSALEQVWLDALEPRYVSLADHFSLGGASERAVIYSILAGEAASRSHADRAALTHYDRAQELLATCHALPARCVQGVQLFLHLARGAVHYRLLNMAQAETDYEHGAELAVLLADLKGHGECLLHLGTVALEQARYREAQVLIRQAMQPFSALDDRNATSRAWVRMGRMQLLQGQHVAARQSLERAFRLALAVQDDAGLAQCNGLQGEIDFVMGRYGQALDALNRAVRLGRKTEHSETIVTSLSRVSLVLLCRGRWGQALESAREAVELAQVSAPGLVLIDAQRVLAVVLTQVGAYDQACTLLDQVLAAFVMARAHVGLGMALCTSGEALLALERYSQASDRFSRALAIGLDSHTVEIIVYAQLGLSKLAAVRQDWPEGHRLCTEARARARQSGLERGVVVARLGLARAYLGVADWRRAQREASQSLDAAYRLRCPYETFCAAATLGEALRGMDQLERAQQRFAEADVMVQRLVDALPHSYARIFLDRPYVRVIHDYAAEQRQGVST